MESRSNILWSAPRRLAAGFGLVEILIGMAIGLLGIMVMMQVLGLSETQRRTSQGGNDAQNNGAIALHGLQREIRAAGYGIGSVPLLGCNLLMPSGRTLNGLAPVTINHASIPAGDANTDTLVLVYGDGNGAPEGDNITAQPATATGANAPDIYAMATPTSFVAGDMVVAQTAVTPPPRAVACNLRLTSVVASGAATGNASNVVVTTGTGLAGASGGRLYNLGANPRIAVYAIRNNVLTRCDMIANDCASNTAGDLANPAIWVPISSNIVSLRAQYGRDTVTPVALTVPTPPPMYVVDLYDQTTPVNECQWARTMAVRLALVARSMQADAALVTAAAPNWYATNASNPGNSTATPIDLSADANWQRYRYKTFQTVVPIRNATWIGVQAGC